MMMIKNKNDNILTCVSRTRLPAADAVLNLNRFLRMVSLVLGNKTTAILYSNAIPDIIASMINQNHKNMNIFSLMIFKASTQRASSFCMDPEAPYLWNVHLVKRGNISTIGSLRSS